MYGFTGATIGQLPCLEISSSVTSYGNKSWRVEHINPRVGHDLLNNTVVTYIKMLFDLIVLS